MSEQQALWTEEKWQNNNLTIARLLAVSIWGSHKQTREAKLWWNFTKISKKPVEYPPPESNHHQFYVKTSMFEWGSKHQCAIPILFTVFFNHLGHKIRSTLIKPTSNLKLRGTISSRRKIFKNGLKNGQSTMLVRTIQKERIDYANSGWGC